MPTITTDTASFFYSLAANSSLQAEVAVLRALQADTAALRAQLKAELERKDEIIKELRNENKSLRDELLMLYRKERSEWIARGGVDGRGDAGVAGEVKEKRERR
ncbi:hypothetical protein MMC13_004230 [Lambiella insularis]|nr:hypothetical protein [Lambiella insularis]